MNREEVENLVIEATGRSDKLSLIRLAINLALTEVSSQRLWSDLQVEDEVTISASSPSVALASDVARVSEIRLIDSTASRVLQIRPKTWLVSKCPDIESRSEGKPVFGYLEGTSLFLYPIPNKSYTIRYTYFRLHPALTLPTSEILIRQAESAVVAYTVWWVFQTLEMQENAKIWYASYQTFMKSAEMVDKSNSAIQHVAEPRNYQPPMSSKWWLDPFVQSNP